MRDVSRLRDHIEGVPAPVGEGDAPPEEIDDDEFEVLRESPELGDGKFKLEICTFSLLPGGRHNESDRTATVAAKTTLNDPDSSSAPSTPIIRTQPPTLSVYITSMAIDFAHTDYETSASMFAAGAAPTYVPTGYSSASAAAAASRAPFPTTGFSSASASAAVHAMPRTRAQTTPPRYAQRLQTIDVRRCHQISREMVQWLRMYVPEVRCESSSSSTSWRTAWAQQEL